MLSGDPEGLGSFVVGTAATSEGVESSFTSASRRSGLVELGTSNKDVAVMVARFAGASLGLFAFTVAVIAGIYVQNPVTVTLSRGIFALFLFYGIGLVLGAAAQAVVREHEKKRESEILAKYRDDAKNPPEPELAKEESEPSEVYEAQLAE
jgi:hypothetical protein